MRKNVAQTANSLQQFGGLQSTLVYANNRMNANNRSILYNSSVFNKTLQSNVFSNKLSTQIMKNQTDESSINEFHLFSEKTLWY